MKKGDASLCPNCGGKIWGEIEDYESPTCEFCEEKEEWSSWPNPEGELSESSFKKN